MVKSTSDNIEEYIKQLLARSGIVEVKRSNLTDTFRIVPSRVNYVIKTRLAGDRGYTIESKRGGGDYTRIVRVRFSDQHQISGNLISNIGERTSEQAFTDSVQLLSDEKIITEREGNLTLATASDDVFGKDAPEIRAHILWKILQRLDRKGFCL